MRLNETRVRDLLRTCDFKSLFVEELGWSHCSLSPITVSVDGQDYTLGAISEMGGLVALQCSTDHNNAVPDYHVRRKIDRVVSKLHYEHIIIYCDTISQVWQWVKREPGKPSASREHVFRYDQSGLPLIQKLDGLVFDLEELDDEGNISIKSVSERVKSALDVDRITKRFYERFDGELNAFKKFITGMTNAAHTDWYASLMLNRLMFVYFIQKKGFLDRDPNYLRNRLEKVKERRGRDKFYSFYRSFLRVLFHDGLNSRGRTPELVQLIGAVPYLNGGLFEEHEIEQESPELDIPDGAFERVFDFFDQYEWHLDTRPMRNDREINPDVLGYIFEKYINQKQMGAYYTKEDITEYISKNTIIPYLFDAAKKKCAIVFDGEKSVWTALRENPDKYIYDAVKKGVGLPLPSEIAAGISDVLQRSEWNKSASGDYALPTEIWREVVARRQRYEEVRAKLEAGDVRSIDDLITLNLDIRQFAQDVIENTESPDLLRAFWEVLRKMTVLDPTCGSGAFLFAALNILEPLYEGCLGRMQEFVDAWGDAGKQIHPNYHKWFSEALRLVGEHSNHSYFIYKSIILNNLYGVDIMPEAVEICKLRLFLKLAAEVDPDPVKANMGLEPLPDIDFNIRAGNTLVGFATEEEARRTVQSKLDFDDAWAAIEDKIKGVSELMELFRHQQTELGQEVTAEDKADLRQRLAAVDEELNRYLAKHYGDAAVRDYDGWLSSHKPFHWFVEFHRIMADGGFDVIVGNPPYVDYAKVRKTYEIESQLYDSIACGNLYAFVTERCTHLAGNTGNIGVILPLSSTNANGNASLQEIIRRLPRLHISHYAVRPSKLFVGVDMNLTIVCGAKSATCSSHNTSSFMRWSSNFRPHLFSVLHYATHNTRVKNAAFPKFGNSIELSIWGKVSGIRRTLSSFSADQPSELLAFHGFGRYWRKCIKEKLSDNYQEFRIADRYSPFALCILNSQMAYWYWIISGDCYRFTKTDALNLPVPDGADDGIFSELADSLLASYNTNAVIQGKLARNGEWTSEKQFFPAKSKDIIDRIDGALASCLGFTSDEVDFLINYDVKYRLGGDSEE